MDVGRRPPPGDGAQCRGDKVASVASMVPFHSLEVLFAACELGVFDLLAEAPAPLSLAAVAARLGASARGTQLLLDACVSLKLLQAETRGGQGKLPGHFEGGVLHARCQHAFSVKGQKVSISSVVGRVVWAAASSLCLWSPHGSQRQHVSEQEWLAPNKALLTRAGRGPDAGEGSAGP